MGDKMKCAGCMKSVKDINTIKCSTNGCGKNFCVLCINVSALSAERKKSWKCPDCCATQRKGGDNSLTPIRASTENVTTRKKSDSNSESSGSDLVKLTEQLRLLTVAFSSLESKLEDATLSLTHSHERMDELTVQLSAAHDRLKYLEKRDQEVTALQAKVCQLQNELDTQSQYNLRNEIEIVGIPESSGENLHHTVLVAATKLGIELDDKDLDWVARVGPRRPPVTTTLPEDGSKMPRPIVVRLLRRSKRDQFIKASKSRKNIYSADLQTPGVNRKVYFNERLTKSNRILFRETRFRAKLHGYAFCWCSQGIVYVRQREGKAAIPIRSQYDMDRLLPRPANSSHPEKYVTPQNE